MALALAARRQLLWREDADRLIREEAEKAAAAKVAAALVAEKAAA